MYQEIVFKDKQKSNSNSKLQSQLRYYIVKLLQMKHEDISDLSVTTSAASEDVSDRAAINESKDILRQYQLTRQQLHRKFQHSSVSDTDISSSL